MVMLWVVFRDVRVERKGLELEAELELEEGIEWRGGRERQEEEGEAEGSRKGRVEGKRKRKSRMVMKRSMVFSLNRRVWCGMLCVLLEYGSAFLEGRCLACTFVPVPLQQNQRVLSEARRPPPPTDWNTPPPFIPRHHGPPLLHPKNPIRFRDSRDHRRPIVDLFTLCNGRAAALRASPVFLQAKHINFLDVWLTFYFMCIAEVR